MNIIMIVTGVLAFLLGFFIAANNPDEAVVAKGVGSRFLNSLRRLVAKVKGLFSKKKASAPVKRPAKRKKKKAVKRGRRG